MPYKAIWKYINIIILWEIGNYRKRNKNEENNGIMKMIKLGEVWI